MYTRKDEHVIFIFELKWKNLNIGVACIFKKAEIRETFLKFELNTLGFFNFSFHNVSLEFEPH